MAFWEMMPYCNFHDMNLTEVIKFINETVDKINSMGLSIEEQNREIAEFKEYVINYLDNLDIQSDVEHYIDELIAHGQLSPVIDEIAHTNDIQFRNFTDRVVMCVSDSYGRTPSIDQSWSAKLKTYLNISNDHFYHSEENGSGFYGLEPTHKFLDQFQSLAGSMTTAEKEAVTDIIICGGYNDATAMRNGTSIDIIRTYIYNTMSYIRSTFPNAVIYLFTAAWSTVDFTQHKYIRIIKNLYQQVFESTTKCSYIDGINWLHRAALMNDSHYHPNAVGAYCIAQSVASVLLGGTVFCDMAVNGTDGFVHPTFTAVADDFNIQNPIQYYENGTCFFMWQRITFSIDSNWAAGSEVVLATCNDGIMTGGDFLPDVYSMTGNTNQGELVKVCIFEGKLRVTNVSGSAITAGDIVINFGSMCGSCML